MPPWCRARLTPNTVQLVVIICGVKSFVMGGPDSSAIGVLPSTRGSLSYAMNSRLRFRRPDGQATRRVFRN